MPGVVRDGDMCSGHGCYPSRPNVTSSTKFFIEGKGIVRVSDMWSIHACESAHPGFQASGSSKMSVQGLQVARIGDSIDCGSLNQTGSSKMFSES